METQERRTHFTTTDEFFFERENGIIQVNFGPTRLQLSSYAAHDLVYRLASYLIYLDHVDGKESSNEQTEEVADTILPDNVLQYPGRRSHEQ